MSSWIGSARLRRASLWLPFALCTLPCLAAAPAQEPKFSTGDRVLLAEYRVLGREHVPLLIATAPARTGAVANALTRLGAKVLGRRDTIGYLYVLVPLDAAGSVLAIEGVQATQVAANPVRSRMDSDSSSSSTGTSAKPRSKGTPPSSVLGPDNPFTDEAATQALDFKTRHPTFDGRGVVIGFVEPIAPNMETMRGALDLSGRPQDKFARYELMPSASAADAITGGRELVIWQKTDRIKPDANGVFSWQGREYRLPADIAKKDIASTDWRICRRLPGNLLGEYDFLWAVNRDRLWALPASAGSDFSKARSVSLREPVPLIQVDGSPDALRMIKALVFRVDRQRGWLTFAPTLSFHGGMVGSVMAGSGFMGSKANGVAPAARISIFLAPGDPDRQTYNGHEQLLEMLSDPRVDVAQASFAVGDTSRFGSPSIQSIWADRLIGANGKPFVKAAGNFGPRLHGSAEFESAESVFAVGGYTSRASSLANLGFELAEQHVLASYSGWGPTNDGGLKPDFLSLTHTLSEGGRPPWYWGDEKAWEYGVSGGTSAAAPHGAGNVALLVSAAKQSRIPHDSARLRAAIATTAKFLDGIEARAQGHGLIQVSDAWDALRRAQKWTPPSFEIQAPLVGAEGGPGGPHRFIGRGLFELSGWKPGQSGRREVIVTRRGGTAGASLYRLRWKGHTNVFRSTLQEIELPLGRAVAIPVDISVRESGSYSAILDLIDPKVDLVAGSILNTVIVADTLVPDGDGLRYERQSPRPGSSLFYVDVPAGLSALSVSITKGSGSSYWTTTDPSGRVMPLNPYGSELYRPVGNDEMARQERQVVYPDPVPGVWQFLMVNDEPRDMESLHAVDWKTPMPLNVHVQGWTGASTESAIAEPNVTAEPIGLGAARETRAVLRSGIEPVFYEVQIDPGTTHFDVQVESSNPNAHVGLYVFKIPEGARADTTLRSDDTSMVYYDASLQQRKHYAIEAPRPGRYRVALDPIDIPGGQIEVAYRDVVHHPLYGSVSLKAPDNTDPRAATVSVRARPEDGRKLYAEIGIFKPVGGKTRAMIERKGWFVD